MTKITRSTTAHTQNRATKTKAESLQLPFEVGWAKALDWDSNDLRLISIPTEKSDGLEHDKQKLMVLKKEGQDFFFANVSDNRVESLNQIDRSKLDFHKVQKNDEQRDLIVDAFDLATIDFRNSELIKINRSYKRALLKLEDGSYLVQGLISHSGEDLAMVVISDELNRDTDINLIPDSNFQFFYFGSPEWGKAFQYLK